MRLVRVRDAPRRGVRIGKRALTVHMRSGVVHGDAALGVALAYGGGCGERNAPLRLRSPLTAGVRGAAYCSIALAFHRRLGEDSARARSGASAAIAAWFVGLGGFSEVIETARSRRYSRPPPACPM
jgi:hypothetical protein